MNPYNLFISDEEKEIIVCLKETNKLNTCSIFNQDSSFLYRTETTLRTLLFDNNRHIYLFLIRFLVTKL